MKVLMAAIVLLLAGCSDNLSCDTVLITADRSEVHSVSGCDMNHLDSNCNYNEGGAPLAVLHKGDKVKYVGTYHFRINGTTVTGSEDEIMYGAGDIGFIDANTDQIQC